MDRTPHLPARRLIAAGLVALMSAGCGDGSDDEIGSEQDPKIVEAIAGIVRAFDDHSVVAIGETHGNAQLQLFLESLLSNPALRARAHTLAVEVGASAQDEIDAYLSGSLDDASLLTALRDSIFSETGAADPKSVELYRFVRTLNAAGSSEPDWSIAAVDSPLRWSEITDRGALESFDREADMSERLSRLVDDGQSVLWVVGGGHLAPGVFDVPANGQPAAGSGPGRSPTSVEFEDVSGEDRDQVSLDTKPVSTGTKVGAGVDTVTVGSAGALFDASHPGQLYVIDLYTGFRSRTAELEERLGPIESPSLILVESSWLANEPGLGLGSPTSPQDMITGSPTGVATSDDAASNALVGIDALLYLGRCDELTARIPADDTFRDSQYVAEINRRLALRAADPFDETEYRAFLASVFGHCDT